MPAFHMGAKLQACRAALQLQSLWGIYFKATADGHQGQVRGHQRPLLGGLGEIRALV